VGQEIETIHFEPHHFRQYIRRLKQETELLSEWVRTGKLSEQGLIGGFELEAWLVDDTFAPACVNQRFMQLMDDPLVAPELAQFNVEFNNRPHLLTGRALSDMERELRATWERGARAATDCNARLLSIGILPTLEVSHLTMDRLSPLNRYYALNEQVLRSRAGRPLRLDVFGYQHLQIEHENMMLEAAGTSFQIHLQAPFDLTHRLYNAALAATAPIVAVGANSPYLFGKDLWCESRIPLFEQSLEVGGYAGLSQASPRRVSLGSGYARESIMECFRENLAYFPVLLPMLFDGEPEELNHLRLHNGTIWRWNRPLIGFDEDGTPHVRIEHRVLAGSPTITDAIADAALFYGLVEGLRTEDTRLEARLPFAQAQANFQHACRHGLDTHITWLDGKTTDARILLLEELLPLARRGLLGLGLEPAECDHYLGIVKQRVQQNQNGARWQREFVKRFGPDMKRLTAAYIERQQSGTPVYSWPL
jgi:gamma-glutamyl:cysteine ligase YbdK (ATP-grasp superfamily)